MLSLDYIDFCGLWLNLSRQDWREAAAVKRGIEMGLGRGDLPMAYFDAVALLEGAIEAMEWDENAARFAAHNYKGRRRG